MRETDDNVISGTGTVTVWTKWKQLGGTLYDISIQNSLREKFYNHYRCKAIVYIWSKILCIKEKAKPKRP